MVWTIIEGVGPTVTVGVKASLRAIQRSAEERRAIIVDILKAIVIIIGVLIAVTASIAVDVIGSIGNPGWARRCITCVRTVVINIVNFVVVVVSVFHIVLATIVVPVGGSRGIGCVLAARPVELATTRAKIGEVVGQAVVVIIRIASIALCITVGVVLSRVRIVRAIVCKVGYTIEICILLRTRIN